MPQQQGPPPPQDLPLRCQPPLGQPLHGPSLHGQPLHDQQPSSPRPSGRRRSLRAALLAASTAVPLALGLLPQVAPAAARAAVPSPAQPSPAQLQVLEAALNGGSDLSALLAQGPGFDPALVELRRRLLQQQFSDLRWQFQPAPPLRDGRPTVRLRVTGRRQEGPHRYDLEADQRLLLETSGGRINGQTVLEEQSILRSSEEPLPVTLLIPDAVLTGQRYDVDVLLDEPLDGAILAGGIVALTGQQVNGLDSPPLQLGALGGGGLFKTVQAPFNPGSQTWAVLLVHPKGIISATKRVRVVSDRSQLNP